MKNRKFWNDFKNFDLFPDRSTVGRENVVELFAVPERLR